MGLIRVSPAVTAMKSNLGLNQWALGGEWTIGRENEARFRLMFPHPTPEVSRTLKESFGMLRKWMKRLKSDHDIPRAIDEAELRVPGNHQGAARPH